MLKRLTALIYYSIFWLVFFFFARLFFILVQSHVSFHESFWGLAGTFLHGIKLDISTIGYYLLLPVLFIIPGLFLNGNWYRIFMKWYTYLLILFSSVVVVADANLYSYWGFRMDSTPLLYLRTPGEAIASVSTLKLVVLIVVIILIALLFAGFYNRLIDRLFNGFEKKRWFIDTLIFLVLWGLLIIPIRGGLGVAPINAGAVYFSNKMFLNHSSINAVWNVGTSVFARNPTKNPYVFGDNAAASALADSLTIKKGIPPEVLTTSRPDILIIVLESFSGYLIGPLGGDSLVTPNINRYAREGILFSEFYASGTRTDKAMPAILNGYPAQPAQSIIKEPKKSQSLPSMVKILIENGYNTAFWYGGEINFANFNSFVIGSGFRSIVTKSNFDAANYNSKWGVHDHILFGTLRDSMKTVKEPFLKVVLTLSSHEPFDVPMATVIEGQDNMSKYKNSVYYADKSLGAFLDWAKETPWWKNTLIILVADHCARVSEDTLNFSQTVFRIPMLWIGGVVKSKGMIVDKLGGQADIPVTLLNQLGLKGSFPFGKDLFSKESKSFAFYTFNDGFGFLTDSSAVAWDHKSEQFVSVKGKNPDFAKRAGKAFLQNLFNDYLKR